MEFCKIEVGLCRPAVHDLASGLADRRQSDKWGRNLKAGLFGELPKRGDQQILTGLNQALRYAPGAGIARAPERTARMGKEELQALPLAAVDQYACADRDLGDLPRARSMCNDYRNRLPAEQIIEAFSEIRIPLRFPRGVPNLEPRDDIRITDSAPVVRRADDGHAELVQLRWSWPGPGGRPVYNFRSEGRRFARGRCLIPADGFYEFTDPEPDAPRRGRKTKLLFALAAEPWFCIAGVWRPSPEGDAFTMLTADPGPDVAPYHARQIVIVPRSAWTAWLDHSTPEAELLRGLPEGSMTVSKVG